MAFVKNPQIMYKLGITHEDDILKRFAKAKNYAKVTLGDGYELIPMLSRTIPEVKAIKVEAAWERMIKKTLWTDVDYNGIGECRVLTKPEIDFVLDNLRKRFPVEIYGKETKGRQGYIKLYVIKLVKKFKVEYDDQ